MNEKGCFYCLHGETMNDTANSNFAISIEQDGDEYSIGIEYDDSYANDHSWTDINFCPMCGRKLEADGEEV